MFTLAPRTPMVVLTPRRLIFSRTPGNSLTVRRNLHPIATTTPLNNPELYLARQPLPDSQTASALGPGPGRDTTALGALHVEARRVLGGECSGGKEATYHFATSMPISGTPPRDGLSSVPPLMFGGAQ
jgi:hypothetical protein